MSPADDTTDAHEETSAVPPAGLDLWGDDAWNGLTYVAFVAKLERHWPDHVRGLRESQDEASRYVRYCRKCASHCFLSVRAYLDKQPYRCEACGHDNRMESAAALSATSGVPRIVWIIVLLGMLVAATVFPALAAMGVVGLVFMWVAICGFGAVGLLVIVAVRVFRARLKHRD
jgi:hypothetical protein